MNGSTAQRPPRTRRVLRPPQWLETARGRLLIQQERRELKAVMPAILGYRMLQVGRWGLSADTAGGSAILRHWIFDTDIRPGVAAQVDPGNLPVASRSVDAVLLPHSLELTPHPHRLLREADRVLCDRGQIILLGFNPLSPGVLMRHMPMRHPWYPAVHRLYSVGRTSDWLGLLDYEIEKTVYFGRGFPWLKRSTSHQSGLPQLISDPVQALLEGFSQAYLVFARKRVIPLTPARRRWESRPKLGPMALPEARVSRVIPLRKLQATTDSNS